MQANICEMIRRREQYNDIAREVMALGRAYDKHAK